MKNYLIILILATSGMALDAPQVSMQAQCDGFNTYVQLSWPSVSGAYSYDIYWAPTSFTPMTLFQNNAVSPFQTSIPTGWTWQDQPTVVGFFGVTALSENPIAYFPFNGSAEDEAHHLHNCVIYGASFAEDRHGVPNSSLRFDGINDYVWMPAPVTESPLSISFWFKLDENSTVRTMSMLRHRSHGYHILFTPQNGQMKIWTAIYVGNGSQRYDYISPTNAVADFNWHHCVISYDENTYKVYIDDHAVLASSVFGPDNPIYYGTYGTAFGRDGDQNVNYFDGWLDEIKYFNYAVSPNEVHDLFHE